MFLICLTIISVCQAFLAFVVYREQKRSTAEYLEFVNRKEV